MKERPILFSGPMVRAILAGTKTQTRRPVPFQPVCDGGLLHVIYPGADGGGHGIYQTGEEMRAEYIPIATRFCPYGKAGDRLWVRETLRLHAPGSREEAWTYAADDVPVMLPQDDPRVPVMLSWAHHKEGSTCVSIHMPRWASRITLEIVSVRCERLHDISEDDAKAEGVPASLRRSVDAAGKMGPEAGAFRELWDGINGKRAPWSSNPWVWRVEFKRCEAAGGR